MDDTRYVAVSTEEDGIEEDGYTGSQLRPKGRIYVVTGLALCFAFFIYLIYLQATIHSSGH
jgi:hypothetical protein